MCTAAVFWSSSCIALHCLKLNIIFTFRRELLFVRINIKPALVPYCRKPNNPENGYFGPIHDRYKNDEGVWFKCKFPYVITGQKDIHCVKGRWSHPEPQCARKCKSFISIKQQNFVSDNCYTN